MKTRSLKAVLVALLGTAAFVSVGPGVGAPPQTQCAPGAVMPAATTPIAYWSNEARCAIVPAGPGGMFGSENFGNKFPGEAAVYMGIIHVAIYDAAVAIEGGYRPYALEVALTQPHELRAKSGLSAWVAWRLGRGDWKHYGKANPNVRPRVPRVIPSSWKARLAKLLSSAPADPSPAAAVAAAAHDTLVGLQPTLRLDASGQAILHDDYTAYLAGIPDGAAKQNGIAIGEQVAKAVLAKRTNDGPNALTSKDYTEDFNQVKELGRFDSARRTAEQTTEARFWTDHDIRQWEDGILRLAAARRLGLVETARLLAMAHVAGGDAMIACFDAKYHYWFWRPYQAIPQAGNDGNPATESDQSWRPLAATPNFPEYPSAHACHSSAVVAALDTFLRTDKVPFTLDSRVTHTTRTYNRLRDVVEDVDLARVLVGFHFRNSDQEGSNLGRKVGGYVAKHLFQPLGGRKVLHLGRSNVKREHR